jgi:hypothetical protein
VLRLMKVMTAEMKVEQKITQKQKDEFTLFMAHNTGEREVLLHLIPCLKKKYT